MPKLTEHRLYCLPYTAVQFTLFWNVSPRDQQQLVSSAINPFSQFRCCTSIIQITTQAEEAERAFIAQIHNGYGRPKGNKTFKQFVEEVYLPWAKQDKKSFKSDESRVKLIVAFFGKYALSDYALSDRAVQRRAPTIHDRKEDFQRRATDKVCWIGQPRTSTTSPNLCCGSLEERRCYKSSRRSEAAQRCSM